MYPEILYSNTFTLLAEAEVGKHFYWNIADSIKSDPTNLIPDLHPIKQQVLDLKSLVQSPIQKGKKVFDLTFLSSCLRYFFSLCNLEV